MEPGDQLRFIGPAGAPFVVTVGVAFSAEYIAAQVADGEWTPVEEPTPEEPKPDPAPAPEPVPAQAPKRRPAIRRTAKSAD